MIDKARLDDFLHTNSWNCPACSYQDHRKSSIRQRLTWHTDEFHFHCKGNCGFSITITGAGGHEVASFTITDEGGR
jgi:hypothetical protein